MSRPLQTSPSALQNIPDVSGLPDPQLVTKLKYINKNGHIEPHGSMKSVTSALKNYYDETDEASWRYSGNSFQLCQTLASRLISKLVEPLAVVQQPETRDAYPRMWHTRKLIRC